MASKSKRAYALGVILFCSAVSARPSINLETNPSAVFQQIAALDPHFNTNLATLATLADQAAAIEKKEARAEKTARATDDLKNLPAAELQKRFARDSAKYDARAFAAIGQLAKEAGKANTAPARDARVASILELQAALRNASRPLVPEKLGFFTSWIFFFKNLSGSSIAQGRTPAANLAAAVPPGGDNGRNDPLPSTFWTRPKAISEEDLYNGFGRTSFPRLEIGICEYTGPKTSSGTHGGFDVEYEDARFKVKFGDLNSEPFTARIFYALGFHADPTDFAPQVKVRYDRRLLREFHLRRPLNMKIAPFGVHLGTVHLQTHYDPFTFIARAVFKDGRQISGAALKQVLFAQPARSHPEDFADNFRTNVEAALDYLVMAPVNVQPRDGPTQSIGSWDFGQLGHENLRELRGAGLLAAWLGWFDSRADNTRLRLVRDTKDVQLQHFFSDLGGGMGAGTGLFSPRGENPNDFTWTFTAPEIIRGPGQMTTPFRIEHFKPTVPTKAFAEMTSDDARWMARLIGQLTENQLRSALIASGYDDAEARLYLEKLASRRDQMIRDLRLANEIPLLRPTPTNREFSYNPATDGPFVANANGATISARESTATIFRGKLLRP